MSDRDKDDRDWRQSGKGDPAYGENARDFGEDGQFDVDPDSDENRDIHRDPTIPPGLQPGEHFKDEKVTGTTEPEKA